MARVTAIRASVRYIRRRTIVLDYEEWRTTSAAVIRTIGLDEASQVDPDDLENDISKAEGKAVRERALRLLAYREHSAGELESKLMDDGYPSALSHELVQDLVRVGLVDDARFAASFAQTLVTGRRLGRRRALAEMQRHGIPEELAAQAIEALAPEDDELDRATALARTWGARTSDARKLAAKLIRKGFSPRVSFEAARIALQTSDDDYPPIQP